MTNEANTNGYTPGQQVRVTKGPYTGREAWFQQGSRKGPEYCFVCLKTRNVKYLHIAFEDIEAV